MSDIIALVRVSLRDENGLFLIRVSIDGAPYMEIAFDSAAERDAAAADLVKSSQASGGLLVDHLQ